MKNKFMLFSGIRTYINFLSRHKVYTFVSVAGFAISLTFVLVLSFYTRTQVIMDSFHEKSDRIYIMVNNEHYASHFSSMGDYITGRFPEVETFVRVSEHKEIISLNDTEWHEGLVMMADPGFFDMFSFPLLSGNPETAVGDRNSAVLSESYSVRLFSGEDPVGKVIFIKDKMFTVTGVMKDFPYYTHWEAPDVVVNYENIILEYGGEGIFTNHNHFHFTHYFLMRPQTDIRSLEERVRAALHKDFPDDDDYYDEFYFMPLEDIYFSDIDMANMWYRQGNMDTTRIYMGITLLVFVIAVLNYINMTVAQSGFRSREMALKKLLGCDRLSIVRQGISEALIMTVVAFCAALLLCLLTENYFDELLGVKLGIRSGFTVGVIAAILLSVAAVALLSGIIPGLILSSFRVIEVVKGTVRHKVKAGYSKVLVVFQLTVSSILLICTFIMVRQIYYMINSEPGFNTENVLIVKNPGIRPEGLAAARDVLMQIPGVEAVGFGQGNPLLGGSTNSYETEPGRRISLCLLRGDSVYLSIFGFSIEPTLSLSAGPNDQRVYMTRQALNLVNPDPGQMRFITYNTMENAHIGGIINDFQIGSMHSPQVPVLFEYLPGDKYAWEIIVKLSPENASETAGMVNKNLLEMSGERTIESYFADELIYGWYDNERRMSRIMAAFTLVSVVIMIMGVFAISLYMIRQKEKEIGVRKVNGATVNEILRLLNGESLMRVGIAFVIACPVAYYAMSVWLRNFSYRIDITIWPFLLSGAVVTILCLVSVSWQSFRAARANPVVSLKSE